MKIQDQALVRLHFELKSGDGTQIEKSDPEHPLIYIHGLHRMLPGVEQALEGHEEGDDVHVELGPEQAYGPYRKEMVQRVPRDKFPPEQQLEPGMGVTASGPQGQFQFFVSEVTPTEVVLEGNHPLAGVTLIFDMTVVEVREATAEEIASAQAPPQQQQQPPQPPQG